MDVFLLIMLLIGFPLGFGIGFLEGRRHEKRERTKVRSVYDNLLRMGFKKDVLDKAIADAAQKEDAEVVE